MDIDEGRVIVSSWGTLQIESSNGVIGGVLCSVAIII